MAANTFGSAVGACRTHARSLLERLATNQPASAKFSSLCDVERSSKHLTILERNGLVPRTRRGREPFLTLNAKPLREVARWPLQYERYWNEKVDLSGAHFAEKSRR
jgi:hypothetical protein